MSSSVLPLAGKVAIVTGGSRGIGRAIALEFARAGAAVMVAARDAAALAEVTGEIGRAGGKAASCAVDLRSDAGARQLVAAAIAAFGGIDIVVNNAGATKRGDFQALTDDDWADGFALKFHGAVRVTRAAWDYLKARRGSVLNIVGTGGRTPDAQFAIGGSVNSAVLALTKALAELGIEDGVQVNAINPGAVRTERQLSRHRLTAKELGIGVDEVIDRIVKATRITRFGEPEDIAALAAFIIGPRGRLLHGSLIDMDGGTTKSI